MKLLRPRLSFVALAFSAAACGAPAPPVHSTTPVTIPPASAVAQKSMLDLGLGPPDTRFACPPGFYNDLSRHCVPDEIHDRHEAEARVVVPESPMSAQGTFFIDVWEVTTADFTACVDAGACTPPDRENYWEQRGGPPQKFKVGDSVYLGLGTCNFGKPERARHPINCVTFEQSQRYCHWVGKRLPTGEEWVRAAAGAEGRKYPWGKKAPGREDLCWGWLWGNDKFRATHPRGTCAIDAHPKDRTPDGVMGMASGVAEWTDEPTTLEYPYTQMDLPYKGPYHMARGASWVDGDAEHDLWHVETRFHTPVVDAKSDSVGFRCAKSR